MQRVRFWLAVAALLGLSIPAAGQAGVLHTEFQAGVYDPSLDLSEVGTAPTPVPSAGPVPLTVGTYTLSGRVYNDLSDIPAVVDKRDIWCFDLAADTYIQSITLVKYDNSSYVAGVGGGGFFGVAKASQITASFPSNPIGNLIGGALIGVAPGVQAGDELLDNLQGGLSFGPFTIPPAPGLFRTGTYSFWFQEGNLDPSDFDKYVDYEFQVEIAAVPEPGSTVLLGMAAVCVVASARRRAGAGRA